MGIFVGYLLVILWNAYQAEVDKVRLRALAQTRLVAEHATSAFDRANLLLIGAEEHLKPVDLRAGNHASLVRRAEIQQLLARAQGRAPGIVGISLAAADGEVFTSSLDAEPNYSIADRRYFQELKAGRRTMPVISEPMKGRLRGHWGIFLARRLEFPDGSFAGVLVANLGLSESFESFYKTVGVEPNMFITLRDAENKLLVRYPVEENWFNTVVGESPLSMAIRRGETEDVVMSLSPIDNIERIAAFRKLDTYPVYAAVGLSKNAALAAWHQQFRVALLVILAVVAAAAFSSHAIRRKERAVAELESAHRELTLAHKQLDGFRQQLEASNARLAESLALSELNASHDELTGLWNRRMLNQRLEETIVRARRFGVPFCLLMFDLDHFKRINDEFGHLVGDAVLQEFTEVICGRIRETDFLARWGGEEFVSILEATNVGQATVLAEELRTAIYQHQFRIIGALTVSIGLAEYRPEDGAMELLRRADQSLYFAKVEGRNRVHTGCSVLDKT